MFSDKESLLLALFSLQQFRILPSSRW